MSNIMQNDVVASFVCQLGFKMPTGEYFIGKYQCLKSVFHCQVNRKGSFLSLSRSLFFIFYLIKSHFRVTIF